MLIWISDDYQRSFSAFSPSHLLQSVEFLLFSICLKKNYFSKIGKWARLRSFLVFTLFCKTTLLPYVRLNSSTSHSTKEQSAPETKVRVSRLLCSPVVRLLWTTAVFDNLLSVLYSRDGSFENWRSSDY